MEKTIIGIDFSINSTAVTIKRGTELLRMYSFSPNYNGKLKAFAIHEKIKDIVTIVGYSKIATCDDYTQDQINKFKNAQTLSEAIINTIIPFINSEVEFRIEGYSFGSSGNSFIDLITYNSFLKCKLCSLYGTDSIKVISPKRIKKLFTGNGNASKCDMVRKFSTLDNSLAKWIVKSEMVKEGEFKVLKPLDDIVDSYAISDISI